ncbi:MAG: beta-lactamase family protein [Candidatus Aminicenantes bacterium]|nr:MAG: beta-lactamase family protein [Candidatus Aminicenantes bacterium]
MRKAPIFRPLILCIAVLTISLASADGNAAKKAGAAGEIVEGDLAKKLDMYLTRITPFGFSGALFVAKDGKVILNKGYGMAIRAKNVPNTSGTVFSTGSITKQFTAAGIMKLEMMGKLKTEDPITKYFDNVPEDKKTITLHNLLTHTSGVIDFTGMDFEVAPRDETMQKILDAPLRHKPGEQFAYSNAGYSMLAAVIEKVSGQSYEEFMNKNIFTPSGMAFTGYRIPEWDKKVVAHWYRGEKDNGTPLEKNYPYWNYLGNGGILSTTEDMYKWHQALLEDKVLSAPVKKKMFAPFLNEYGYGWDIIQREMGTLIQHDGGSMLGCSAEFRRYIDAKIVTMVFCNQSYGQRALFEAVRDKIEMLVFGGEVAIPPEVSAQQPDKLLKFVGTYKLATGGQLQVKREDKTIVISAHGQDAISVLFEPGNPDPVRFEELNKLAASVFEAALKGDYEPFGNVLANKERRMKPVQELIEMRLRMYKPRTGEIKNVKSLGTLSSTLDGEKVAMTYVELKGEKGSMFFELYWQDSKNVGVGPAPPPGEMALPFLPVSESEFVGYKIDSAVGAKIGFKMDDSGSVIGLVIPGDQDFMAPKHK